MGARDRAPHEGAEGQIEMDVKLVSDGRVFECENGTFEPGDVAWFEEDVLLVIEIRDGVALAVEHPAALQMMGVALDSVKRGRGAFEDAMRIHARTLAQMAAVAAKRAPPDAGWMDLIKARKLLRSTLESFFGLMPNHAFDTLHRVVRDVENAPLGLSKDEAREIVRATIEAKCAAGMADMRLTIAAHELTCAIAEVLSGGERK